MKVINEYLKTKIKNPKYFFSEFPKEPNHKEIIDFLENKGYSEYEYSTFGLNDIVNVYKDSTKLTYIAGECLKDASFTWWVRFTKYPGRIGTENPLFFCRTIDENIARSKYATCYEEYFGKDLLKSTENKNFIEYKTYREFKERIDSFFEW